MTLTEINIYPVKSMGRIRMSEALVQLAGLQYDRRWMLLDEQGTFMTQREHPTMAKVDFAWKEEGFEVSFRGSDIQPEMLPFATPDAAVETVQVWKDEIEARLVQGGINNWLSEVLDTPCRLYQVEKNAMRRSLESGHSEINSFADVSPFLIIGEASLADLNSRIETPVPMTRFRPNFVFEGGTAFQEDNWDTFKIGDVAFKRRKKCGRCIMTTIDQQTGVRQGNEPFRTLREYRTEDRQAKFGLAVFTADGQGEAMVRVGDSIMVE